MMHIFICLFTALVTFFGSLCPAKTVPPVSGKDFVPTVRFMVCSDTHIQSAEDFKNNRIKRAVSFCYQTAQSSAVYTGLDAVMFVGDLTDGGTDEQFEAFRNTVKSCVNPDTTKILAVVASAHDSTENGKKSTKWCSEITGNGSDFHTVINGYHFIGLSTCAKENKKYDFSQRIWLEKQLAQAAKDNPQKPIFVCHHEHLGNTVYGSEDWDCNYFKDIFFRYPQIVHFSGHSHYPLNDPRSVWQGNITAIGTSSMNYLEFKVDGDEPIHPEGCTEAAQAWLVEVGNDNRIRLRGFDVITCEWLCDYFILCPADNATNYFSPANMKNHSSAPVFANEAKIQAVQANGKYTVTVPSAVSTDANPVFLYRLSIRDNTGKVVHSEYIINNYWSSDVRKTVDFTVEAEKGNTLSVLAENCYGMKSAPLSCTIF